MSRSLGLGRRSLIHPDILRVYECTLLTVEFSSRT
jgi:hypothetical protein